MDDTISATELRLMLPQVVERVRRGARITVLYRSRRAFRIVPIDEPEAPRGALAQDSLYRAKAVGRSADKLDSADHDRVLYGS